MKTITQEQAEDIVWGHDVVAFQEVSTHRWHTKKLVVFRSDDTEYATTGVSLWGFYYLDPLTELQDGQDMFESDPVEVFPVDARQVVTTVYERHDDATG